MSLYTTKAAIESEIPAHLLLRALDQNLDGAADPGPDGADPMDAVIARASQRVDALVSPVIMPAGHPVAAWAAQAFALESLYRLAQIAAESNPWITTAKDAATKLARIAAGTETLTTADGAADTEIPGAGYEAPENNFTDTALNAL